MRPKCGVVDSEAVQCMGVLETEARPFITEKWEDYYY
jgi:hypothetical protein